MEQVSRNEIWALVLTTVLAWPLAAKTVDPQTPAREDLVAADRRLELRRLTALLDAAFRLQHKSEIPGLLEELRRAAPESAQYPYFMGLDAFVRGEKMKALELAKQAIGKDSAFTPAYTIAGIVLAESGQDRLATVFFEKALEQSPHDPIYILNLALCKNRLGQKREALLLLDQALASRSNLTEAMFWKAQLLAESGQSAEAIKWIRAAIEGGEKSNAAYRLWMQIAADLSEESDLAQALNSLLAEKSSTSLRLAAEFALRTGEHQRCAAALEKIFAAEESIREDRRRYVTCLAALGRDPAPWIRTLRVPEAEKEELRVLFDTLDDTPDVLQSRDPLVRSAN